MIGKNTPAVFIQSYMNIKQTYQLKLSVLIYDFMFCPENMYDVFLNIRDDEAEHCKTMKACQTLGNIQSPHASSESVSSEDDSGVADCEGIVDCMKKSGTPDPLNQSP